MEEWKDIEGYEGLYQISNIGNVKRLGNYIKNSNNNGNLSFRKGRIIKTNTGNHKYDYVCLCKEGIKKKHYIHRLVANNFIINKNNKPCINHIDGNKQNNCVENLEYCTQKENIQHAWRIGLFTKKMK